MTHHFDLQLTLCPENVPAAFRQYGGEIWAQGQAQLVNHEAVALKQLSFLLYRLLRVNQITDRAGHPLPFSQTLVTLDEVPRMTVNHVQILLGAPLAPGETVCINIEYGGPICGYPEVFPYVQDHISEEYTLLRAETLWLPTVCEPGSFSLPPFTYHLSIQYPNNSSCYCNGQQRSIAQGSCEWERTQPEDWGRLIVACAPFVHLPIHDQVVLHVLPQDSSRVQPIVQALRFTLQCCTNWFGKLPVEDVHIVEMPAGYGMESADTLMIFEAEAFAPARTEHEAFLHALSLIGHELIHLWNAPSREVHNTRFLDESITHYIEALVIREMFGEEEYRRRMNDFRKTFLAGGEAANHVSLSNSWEHYNMTVPLSRGKGPWLMAALHKQLGTSFLPALQAFFDRCRESGATPEDFQHMMQEYSPQPLQAFFQQWYYQPGPIRS